MQILSRKTSLAVGSFLLLAGLPEIVPELGQFRVAPQNLFASMLDFGPRWPIPEPLPLPPRPTIAQAPAKPAGSAAFLTVPAGSLDAFYQALARTDAKAPGAVTRILHYGDSPVTADSITADARALFQARFGDAGHGFVLIAKPWAWYGHRGVEIRSSHWHIEAASQSRNKDGFHGLGGVNFRGEAGASARLDIPAGHNRMEVLYLREPGGGAFAVEANGQSLGEVETKAEEKAPGFAPFVLPPSSDEITIRVTAGSVRLFGASFEKDGPGIIYSSLGLNGGQVQVVLRYFEPHQWALSLEHERPDLVILNYGTNESVFPQYIDRQYPDELRQVIRRVRNAVPKASLLIMSPMDRGERQSNGEIGTPAVLPHLIDWQRRIAAEAGCAFFNTYEAMGGAGTMARWYASQPRLVSADFMHPLPAGAKKVGTLLEDALYRGYQEYNGRMRRQLQAKVNP